MFSVYPQYYYDDYDNYYRTLAAQRARERREAEYRARFQEARQRQQLEEMLRCNAYQNHLARERRRRSMYPYYSGFDSDEDYLESPNYLDYFEHPVYEPMQAPRRQEFSDNLQHHRLPVHGESVSRNTTSSPRRRESPVLPQEHMEQPSKANYQKHVRRSPTPARSSSPKRTTVPIRGPSPKPDVKDQAARKIQVFLRAKMPRYKALKAISSVAQEFQHIVDSFTFPTSLDFAESDSMQLLFTPRNAPLHLYEHTLLGFLSKLDSIESHGDKDVRAVRKDLVKRIENELEKLDARKVSMWETQRTAPVTSPVENEVSASQIIVKPTQQLEGTPVETTEGAMETDQTQLSQQPSSVIVPAEDEVSATSMLDHSMLDSEDAPIATVERVKMNHMPLPEADMSLPVFDGTKSLAAEAGIEATLARNEVEVEAPSTVESPDDPMVAVEGTVESDHAPLPAHHLLDISPPSSDVSESLVEESGQKPTLASIVVSEDTPMMTAEGTAESDQVWLPGENCPADISPPSSDDSESSVIGIVDEPTLVGTCRDQPAELSIIRPSDEQMQDEPTHQESMQAHHEFVPLPNSHCEVSPSSSESRSSSDPSENTQSSWEIIQETKPSNDMGLGGDQPTTSSADIQVQELVSSVNDTIRKLFDATQGDKETNDHATSISSSTTVPVEVSV